MASTRRAVDWLLRLHYSQLALPDHLLWLLYSSLLVPAEWQRCRPRWCLGRLIRGDNFPRQRLPPNVDLLQNLPSLRKKKRPTLLRRQPGIRPSETLEVEGTERCDPNSPPVETNPSAYLGKAWKMPCDSKFSLFPVGDNSGTVPKTKRMFTCGELKTSVKPWLVLGRRSTGVLGTIPPSSKASVSLPNGGKRSSLGCGRMLAVERQQLLLQQLGAIHQHRKWILPLLRLRLELKIQKLCRPLQLLHAVFHASLISTTISSPHRNWPPRRMSEILTVQT